MDRIDEVKQWIETELFPNIVKSGKLKQSENGKESFELVDICIRPVGADEAFMLTNCYKVKVVYVSDGKEDTCSLIVKKTPQLSVESYDAVNFDTLFHNEIAAYTKIIPTLRNFIKQNIEELNFPKYYYSNQTESAASIVLGDFNADGWKMSEKLFNLSLEHIIIAVEHIGVFHALGYALKSTERKTFDALVELVKESRYCRPYPEVWKMTLGISIQRLKIAMEKFSPQVPLQFRAKLIQLISDNFTYSKKRLQPIEPYATLCHGDFLRNNIAFKYSSEDPDRPTGAMMFDFQTLRYSSPMVDLCVLLALSSGRDVRSMHFDKILDAYHHKLTSTFATLTQEDVPTFMSKGELLREYVQYLPFGLTIASFFLQNLHDPNGVVTTEMMDLDVNMDLIAQDLLNRGGDAVNEELAALVNEVYGFTVKENVDIFENFI